MDTLIKWAAVMPLFGMSSGSEASQGLSSASSCGSHRASVNLAQPQVIPAIHPQLILHGLSQSPMYPGTARYQAISPAHLFSNPLVERRSIVLLLLLLLCNTKGTPHNMFVSGNWTALFLKRSFHLQGPYHQKQACPQKELLRYPGLPPTSLLRGSYSFTLLS